MFETFNLQISDLPGLRSGLFCFFTIVSAEVVEYRILLKGGYKANYF